jgi:hypothetical protein
MASDDVVKGVVERVEQKAGVGAVMKAWQVHARAKMDARELKKSMTNAVKVAISYYNKSTL